MTRDGVDPAIMDLDHDKSVASQMNVELVEKGPPLKEDEKYQKYFKMLKMVRYLDHYVHCVLYFCLFIVFSRFFRGFQWVLLRMP